MISTAFYEVKYDFVLEEAQAALAAGGVIFLILPLQGGGGSRSEPVGVICRPDPTPAHFVRRPSPFRGGISK
jgi:hypothetical protein